LKFVLQLLQPRNVNVIPLSFCLIT